MRTDATRWHVPRLVRGLVVLACLALISLVLFVFATRAQEAPQNPTGQTPGTEPGQASTPAPPQAFQITGIVKSGKAMLPGVTVTAANTLTGKKYSAVTNLNGSFVLSGLPRGRYVVKVEFMGFATQTQEVVLNPENPAGKLETELILASRQREQTNNAASFAEASRGFQSLAMDSTLSAMAGGAALGTLGNGQANGSDISALPMNGAGAEGPTESVSISGAQGRSQDFGNLNEEELQDRIQEFRERAQREGLVAGQGGPGGPGGFGGPGGGRVMIGRIGRFNINQPHGVLYFQDDNSIFDARPYSLTGLESPKADYNQSHFGAFVGGPLNIPKIYNGGKKTFFFAGWNGSRGSSPVDAFTTVPTLAERSGSFSGATYNNGTPVTIYDPQTQQPFANNTIDPTKISASAQALLAYIPLPNLPTAQQNFHFVTTSNSNTDSVNLRLVHNFGDASGPGLMVMGGGPMGGGGGGRGGGRRPRNNINFGMNWMRSANDIVGNFPSLAGNTGIQGLNANGAWIYGKGKLTNNLRFNYNHNHVSTTNLYSGLTNVAGLAGIGGVSSDPFDWGLPGISFTTFGGLSDPTPRRELDQTYTISDTIIWNHGKQNWRFGGDYRRILQSFRSATNAEGSFVFTGFATAQYAAGNTLATPDTGYDFADFLLGLPQQTTLQSGANSYDFAANSYDFYVQDDWRVRGNLTLNLGLRYEYNGPYTEAHNRIVNLDVAPGFASAVPVMTGATGQFSGVFPDSLVRPDRNNFAPRIGIAWRPGKGTVVRTGYGINYNLAQYRSFIQNFAFQPPFAETATNVSVIGSPDLTLANGFPTTGTGTVTNNFAVDPNYRLGYVQIWNLNVQRQLADGFLLNVGYNGSKGTRLDVERAILVAGAQPFLYESSAGNSILHSGTVSIRKRMAKGLGFGATYVYSKSIDDASSIGGGGSVVAQDPFDIAADRGLSSFDQRHKFTGNWIYDLPFGDGRRFVQKGALSHVLSGWVWSGDFTMGSGLYFTPRVLGGTVDITRGVSGSLRANYVGGQTVSLGDPTTAEWFNTGAFCAPGLDCVNPAGSSFGDAGRNIIEGPGQFSLNMSMGKTIQISEIRALELRIQASNVFNTAYFTNINTVVNSLTFGQVTGAGNMRRVTMVARFRF